MTCWGTAVQCRVVLVLVEFFVFSQFPLLALSKQVG